MSDFPEPLHDTDIALEVAKPKLKRPPLYKVLLLNDDYTTMEFVIKVLCEIFNHSQDDAIAKSTRNSNRASHANNKTCSSGSSGKKRKIPNSVRI